jgi:hypothetical protein
VLGQKIDETPLTQRVRVPGVVLGNINAHQQILEIKTICWWALVICEPEVRLLVSPGSRHFPCSGALDSSAPASCRAAFLRGECGRVAAASDRGQRDGPIVPSGFPDTDRPLSLVSCVGRGSRG